MKMKRSRRTMALLVCLVMCFVLLAACNSDDSGAGSENTPGGGATTTPTGGSSGTQNTPSIETGDEGLSAPPEDVENVVFAEHIEHIIGDAVAIINPHNPAGDGSSHNNACRMIYDSLYYNQPDGSSTPMLATSYETTDYQTWIFHLRDDVYFHNGDKFTSGDVIFTWQNAVAAVGSIAAGNWNYIVEANAIDEYTVEFKTATPYGNLLFNIGISVSGILNERAIAEDPIAGFYVGTGAYYISDFSMSDYIKFERNDRYWGELPYTKSQTWRLVAEASARTIMLQNGTAQIGGVPQADLDLFRDDENFRIHIQVSNNSMALMFNMEDPICSDLNFRMAVAHALKRDELAIFAMGSLAVPVEDGTIWGYQVPFKNTRIPYIQHDLDLARRYLADSVYNGQTIELSIISSGSAMGEGIQEQLRAIGIDITINPMDVPTFMTYTSASDNKAQMLTYFCMMSQNPVDTYRVGFYPLGNNNRMRYNNPIVTEMLDQAPAILGEAAQREHFERLQEIVVADLPALPIYWMPGATVYPSNFGGLVTSASAHNDLRYIYMIIE